MTIRDMYLPEFHTLSRKSGQNLDPLLIGFLFLLMQRCKRSELISTSKPVHLKLSRTNFDFASAFFVRKNSKVIGWAMLEVPYSYRNPMSVWSHRV